MQAVHARKLQVGRQLQYAAWTVPLQVPREGFGVLQGQLLSILTRQTNTIHFAAPRKGLFGLYRLITVVATVYDMKEHNLPFFGYGGLRKTHKTVEN